MMIRGMVLVLPSLVVVAMADAADDAAKANYATMQAMIAAFNKNPTSPYVMFPWMEQRLKEAKVFEIDALLDSAAKPLVDLTNVSPMDANEAETKAMIGKSMAQVSAKAWGNATIEFAAPIFGSGGRKILTKWTFLGGVKTISYLGIYTFNDNHKLIAFTDYWLPPTHDASAMLLVGQPYASSVPTFVLGCACGILMATFAYVLGKEAVSRKKVAASESRRKLLEEVQTQHS
jgi:hypothetical protein